MGFFQAIGVPLGIIAPTGAVAAFPQVMAGSVGASGPLVILIGLVVGLFIAYSFASFAQVFATAGSAFTFNGVSMGASYGFVSAWMQLFAYIVFGAATCPLCASLLQTLIPALQPVPWWLLSLAILLIALALSLRSVELASSVSSIVEGIGIIVIIVIGIFVFVHGGHGGHGISSQPLRPGGNKLSGLAFGVTFAFSAFAGFESASALGEETLNPRRAIPRAIVTSLLIGAVTLAFGSYVLTVALGPTALAASTSPLTQVAKTFVDSGIGSLINLVALFSIFGSTLGNVNATSRLLFAFGRDGFPHPRYRGPRLSKVNEKYGTPDVALFTVAAIMAMIFVGFAIGGNNPTSAFDYISTMGGISILLCYLLTVIGATVFFTRRRLALRKLVFLYTSIPVVGYVVYRQAWPIPAHPYNLLFYAAVAWSVLGVVLIVLNRPLRDKMQQSEMFRLETVQEAELLPEGK